MEIINEKRTNEKNVYLWNDKNFTLFEDDDCDSTDNITSSGGNDSNGANDSDSESSSSNSNSGAKNCKKKRIDPNKLQFVLSMMQENLTHGRHVEMEKISYSALHTALTVAAVVFIGDISGGVAEDWWSLLVRLMYCIGLTFLCIISIKFNLRWGDVFDYHKETAAGCYYILHRDLIGIDRSMI